MELLVSIFLAILLVSKDGEQEERETILSITSSFGYLSNIGRKL